MQHLVHWWHIGRRDRKLAQAMQQADALICFHAKSGSTWLRAMVSHVYHQRYGTPADVLLQHGNLREICSAVPYVYFGDGLEVRSSHSGRLLARARDEQRVLFLLRDPRDISVSFYHHLRERATERELLRKRVPSAVRALTLYDFMFHPDFGLPRVIERFNRWAAESRRFNHATITSYEALWNDTPGELARVMRVLGEDDVPEDILKAAADFASFSSLKEKERRNFFKSERLRPVQVDGREAFKVRQGGIHGYQAKFSAEELVEIDAFVEAHLNPSLGYGASDRREVRA